MRTVFRPMRSVRVPRKGVIKAPGRVKTEMRSPICCRVTPRAWAALGKAGVMLATPMTETRVIPKTRFRSGSPIRRLFGCLMSVTGDTSFR